MEENTKQQETATKNQHSSDFRGFIDQLEAFLDEYMIKKAPFAIPLGGKEFIVTISPYLIIIFAIMALPFIFVGLGLSVFFAPVALLAGHNTFGAFIGLVFAIITLIVEVVAIPGLFARTKKAWRLVFYASIISLLGSILTFNIVSGVIGAIIGWYILFQVKELYRN